VGVGSLILTIMFTSSSFYLLLPLVVTTISEDEISLMSKVTKLCLNCDGEMIERNPGNYICSNCGVEMTAED
jgi:predicted RNA-binding Zn-ribbon protein involved in translation (DUF1610 family)